MKTWDINALEGFPGPPRVLSTTDETRAIVLGLDEDQVMAEHQVHERAWIVVISGHVRVTDDAGTRVDASSGFTFELEPNERHSVLATTDARLLLLLAPWPGAGHPREATRMTRSPAQRDVPLRAGPLPRESRGPVDARVSGLTPAQKAEDRWATDGGRLLQRGGEHPRTTP
ncbi:cupin domain-containing protein [Patulibacter sp. NPDC049589]|uniref:cupin domain-containing protein n=1 Tax=Patulibacter sp. NPDC049589 TaxID=3154731 RepID=UPI003433B520